MGPALLPGPGGGRGPCLMASVGSGPLCRFGPPEGVTELRCYLDKNADRLDYPHYKQHSYPISSGMMKSACKQLGLRIKGPGMRWNTENVTPMATLVSLWINNEWDTYWRISA